MYLPENSSLVCDLRAILAYRGSRNFPTPILSSPKMGRWVRFTPKSAPIVPEDGTMGALYSLKCSYRPRRWDDGRVLPPKVLLSSPKMGRWARFTPQGAPSGPSDGPEGAASAGCAASGEKKGSTANGLPFFDCVCETGYASLRESRRWPRRSPPRRSPPRRSRRSPPRSELAAADADTPAFGLRSRLP